MSRCRVVDPIRALETAVVYERKTRRTRERKCVAGDGIETGNNGRSTAAHTLENSAWRAVAANKESDSSTIDRIRLADNTREAFDRSHHDVLVYFLFDPL